MSKIEMSNAEYHASEGISSSDFRLLEKSPIHLENKPLFGLDGDNFLLGTLVHKMVLEADTVYEEFIKGDFEGADISTGTIAYEEALPLIEAMRAEDYTMFIEEVFENDELNKNTKVYKESKALFVEQSKIDKKTIIAKDIWRLAELVMDAECLVGDRTLISNIMWEQAEKMAKNVMAIAGGLLQNGVAEESFFVEDKQFGITRKCRPDYYREDLGLCIDLKTTADGSEHGFAKSIHSFAYHRQSSWYLDTLDMADISVQRFIFITVESKAPYMVDVWEMDGMSIAKGREQYEDLLIEWKNYKDKGIANVVKTISLPAWAFTDE